MRLSPALTLSTREYVNVLGAMGNMRDLSRIEYDALLLRTAMAMYPNKKWDE